MDPDNGEGRRKLASAWFLNEKEALSRETTLGLLEEERLFYELTTV